MLVCVGTDDDIWVHRSKHSLFTPTAKFLCVFWIIVTTFGDVLGNEYISSKSVKNYSVFDNIKTEVNFTFWNSNFRKGRLSYTEWEKGGVGSHRTCGHFFWLIARILTIFDKKYRILTRRDKRESYLIVLQQNNV